SVKAILTIKLTAYHRPISICFVGKKLFLIFNKMFTISPWTSEPVESLAQALRVIDIYTHRWRIEDFHKAWKTGAGAERQRMEEPDNLERMVSILSFVAVRLLQLRESFTLPQALRAQGLLKEAEFVESQSAETVLTSDECQLLGYLDKGKRKRKEKAGSLQWAYMAIARLGGFMDSKRTG
ncbi:transposase, partial [Aeromonas sp. QDB21]|uniref:transposase n=1 Tax=Aeromonas sp. QDB21 TaxID=2990487 RepID=UPI0022E05BDC